MGACIPDACVDHFSQLALPRILELRVGALDVQVGTSKCFTCEAEVASTGGSVSLPSAWPCASTSQNPGAKPAKHVDVVPDARSPSAAGWPGHRCKGLMQPRPAQQPGDRGELGNQLQLA